MENFKRFFRRRHPYLVVHYLGRKNVETIFDAKIEKRSKIVNKD